MNSSGPSVDPCGTPTSKCLKGGMMTIDNAALSSVMQVRAEEL